MTRAASSEEMFFTLRCSDGERASAAVAIFAARESMALGQEFFCGAAGVVTARSEKKIKRMVTGKNRRADRMILRQANVTRHHSTAGRAA